MSSKNRSVVRERMNTVSRKRLYKANGHWTVATTGTVALAAAGALGTVSTVHADTGSPVDAAPQVASVPQVSTNNAVATNTEVAPVVASANVSVNQAVQLVQPQVSIAGGNVTSTTPQAVDQNNVGKVAQDANRQISNISEVGSADAMMNSAIQSGSSATKAMGGSYYAGSAQDASSMTTDQIQSFGQSMTNQLSAVGAGNAEQLSAANANGQLISNAAGVMAPGSTMDVSKLKPEEIASMTSRAAAVLSATGSADFQLVSASNQYTSDINAVGGQLKRSGAINTADNMTPDMIRSSVLSQIVGISQTASADALIKSAVGSALPQVNANSGKMSAGSTIDASTLDPAVVASMVAQQSLMVSATASGDSAILNARNQNQANINAAGGQLIEGSHVNTADNMTPEEIQSMVASQIANIDATGQVDGSVALALSNASHAAHNLGVDLLSGQNIDVSSMTPDQIKALGQMLVNNLSMVAQHDEMINSAVPLVSGVVSSAGGKMTPGSTIDATDWTPDQIASEEAQQSAMISATGSADADVQSHANSAGSDISQAGGTITQSGTINTAYNMTVSDVASHVANQDSRISQTASADRVINQAVSNNASVISNANGIEKPGKAIDTTNLTSEQVDSLVKNQEAMISATGSADADVQSHANSASSDINQAGGTITQSGTINTADNMTVSDVASHVASQDARISQTASADRAINQAVSNNASAISNASGVEKPGKAIDTTNLTSEQVDLLVKNQEAMVSATGSADADVQSHANSASFDINQAGGTITQSGTINTADNMTVSEVASHVASQDARISQTASADRAINQVVSDNAFIILNTNGVEKPGKAIDTTNLTSEQVDSLVKHQEAMVSATGSADADVQSHANSASSDINRVGGTITQSGTINTADNMTVSDVASHVASQDARISQTASADRAINQVVSDNASAISNARGVEKPGKAIDTTNLTSEQVDSLVKHQEAMVSATGSADADVQSHANSASFDINRVGGTITQSGTVNTADNMTVSEVASHVASQDARISQTASADRVIGQVVSNDASAISNASGVEKPGKAIDTTNLTAEQVDSLVKHQEAMVSATGSADAEIKSDVDSATGDITKIGGKITLSGTVNTADNMTLEEIASDVAKQSARISETASADRGINSVVSTSSTAISAIGGITKPGKDIDTTNLTSGQIASMVSHQEAMVSATASADTVLKSMIDGISNAVKSNAGFITASGSVNTADNMTVDQIKSSVDTQLSRLSAVNVVDQSLADMIKNGSGTIFGGNVKAGKAIDVSNKTGDQILSMGRSQAALVSQVINNNVMLSNAEASVASIVAKVGGKVSKGAPIDVTGKTVSEIASLAKAQAAVLSAVADVDDQLNSALQNKSVITKVGGTLTRGTDINAASMTPDQICDVGKRQAANISATASGDAMIQNAVDKVWSQTATRGSATDVSSMTPAQIASLTASEADALGETQNANEQLSQAVKQTSESIHRIGGKTIAVPTRDTTTLTSDQIGSSAASQTGKLAETATADDLVSTAVSQHKGVVMSSVNAINTTNMGSQQIVSEVTSQVNHISHTDSMQRTVSNQVHAQLNKVTTAGGQIRKSGIFDTTSMTEYRMTSWTNSENAHLEHVGSNDAVLTSTINAQHNGLAILGGSAVSQAAIDVTSMTDAEIDSLMQSQATLISQAASANLQMKSMYDRALAEGAVMTSVQASLSNKAAIDSLLTSITSALSSAVTVAKTSKMVSSAVNSFNTAMEAVIAQYKQAGGNPLDAVLVTINPGVDASTVSATASSALASLSAQNSKVESQMSVATETMNYITNNVSDMIKSLGSEAQATPHLTYTSAASNRQVHSLGDIKSDWEAQKSVASSVIAAQKHANSNSAKVADPGQVGYDKVLSAVSAAKAVGVKVSFTGSINRGSYVATDDGSVASIMAVESNDNSVQVSAINSAIALQKQYDQQYSEASQSAQTKYDNEYSSYVTKSNSIATSYGSAINSYNKASTVVSQANQQTVNKQNSDKLQAAVQAAKAAGVQVTQNQTQTLTATSSTYNSVKQDVNNKYNQQVSSLKSITDAQKDLNNRYNSAKADAQNLNSDSNSTRNSLDSAIRNAKSTNGVKLIDEGTRNVTVDVNNYNSKKSEIERDNKQQADSINSQVQQYKNEYAKWEKDNQQFLEAAAAKTGWSVKQVLDFLGQNLPNVSYVSAGDGMTFDKGTLQSFSQSELSSILNNHKVDPALKNYIASKAYGNLYKLSQGLTWKYNNAFTDTKSGKSVDLKVTVQGLGLDYSGRYGLPPMIMVGEKYIGSDVAGIGAVKYGLTFLEHGTNTPINITSLIGIGDVDAAQSVAVYNATSALRGSENKNYSGNGYLGSINTNGVDDFSEGKNTQYQSWFLVPNSSTVSYVFSAADPAWGNGAPDGSGFMGFYHQNLGGIPLPIKSTPIIPPTLRYHHTNVAVQPPTPLKANYTEYVISTTPPKTPPTSDHVDPPVKDTVTKKYASVSYHSNTALPSHDSINMNLTLHGYYDNDRFAPVKAKSEAPKPKMTVTSADPIYHALSTTVPDVKTNYHAYDTNLIDHFNYQYSPLSTKYHVYNDEGGYNPENLNYSPVGTTYVRYDTDGTNVPPMIPDPNHPGKMIPNSKFTGYTPWSTTWHDYSTDGTNIPPMIPDPNHPGKMIPNPKFTGYTPWSTTWKNYSTDGSKIPPMIPDPKNPGKLIPNPKFSGYTPWSTTWQNYSTDGTNIPPMIPDPNHPGKLIPNPKFSGYTPWSTTWQNYSTDGTNIPPMIPDPKNPGKLISNPKFTGYTPWSTTWQNYSTDGTNIPPMIPDPKNPGKLIPNPKFSGYTPWSTTWQNYSSDGQSISKTVSPVIPDPNHPGKYIKNPKFTGYAPMTAQKRALSTKYMVLDSDGSNIPPMIPDPNHPGKLIPNPKFTGYAPFSYTYSPYSDDGTKVPSMIPDGHGGWKPNPNFTGYAPLSTTYTPLSTKYHDYVDASKPAQPVASPAATLQPSPAVAPSVAPAPLAQLVQAPSLPQTGHQDSSYLALIGLAVLASVSVMSLRAVRKKHN